MPEIKAALTTDSSAAGGWIAGDRGMGEGEGEGEGRASLAMSGDNVQ